MNRRFSIRDLRVRRVLAGVATAFVGKGINLLTSLTLVPLTLRYLGAERYGVWVIISSAIAMYLVLDVGIANTLTNLVSEAYATGDTRRSAASFTTALYTCVGIAAFMGAGGLLLAPHLSWQHIFHVHSPQVAQEAAAGVGVAFAAFLLLLPLSLCQRVLAGHQQTHVANGFNAAGSLLALGAVFVGMSLHGTIPWLVGCYAGANVLTNAVCLIWLSCFHMPWMLPAPRLFDRALVRVIFSSGFGFFAIQLAGIAVFSTDNLIIGHYLSPEEVTPYSVAYRFVSTIAILQTLAFPSLWPAYSEAHARGDYAWLRRSYSRVRLGTWLILVFGCGCVLIFGRTLIRIWAGASAVPSLGLLALMCVWITIYAITMNQSCLMGATARVNRQAIASLAGACLNIVLSILWVRPLGSAGVLLGTIVSYLVFVVGVQAYEVHRILHAPGTHPSASLQPPVPEYVEP